jgi:nucleotide-binding universal stress UspA family protein
MESGTCIHLFTMMNHIQRILVPVDLSEPSLNALDTAVEIAKKNSATLIILNIAERNIKFFNKVDSPEYFNNVSEDVLNALAGAIEQRHEITLALKHRKGHVAECIISTSIGELCDLIIMGTHGASGYRENHVGSNTYNVIKYSECPVLTIPPNQKYSSFSKVLFPIRPSNGALARYDVACHFMSTGSILQVLGLPYQKLQKETSILDKIVDEIRYQLHEDKVKVTTCWEKADTIGNDIIRFADANESDLLVITSALDPIAKQDFVGPHTQKLINLSKIPVLIINKNSVPLNHRSNSTGVLIMHNDKP